MSSTPSESQVIDALCRLAIGWENAAEQDAHAAAIKTVKRHINRHKRKEEDDETLRKASTILQQRGMLTLSTAIDQACG